MNNRLAIGTAVLLLTLPARAQGQEKTEKDEISRTFTFTGTEKKRVVVDNIDGSIDVAGYDGNEVRLVVKKTIEAESNNKIQEAKEAVVLEIKEELNKVILYVDAPWRTPNGINYRGFHYYGYRVRHDFQLLVPRKTSLYLRTVNEGTVRVHNVEGEFEVKNVNAGVELTNIAGLAQVATVNGPVKVSFSKNPEADCSFKTVN
ncbi:MAG: hypothetical protein ACRDGA_06825, partial [Bacteroidota bacterium]